VLDEAPFLKENDASMTKMMNNMVFAAVGSFEARRYYEACGRAQSRIAVFDSGGINVD
jgi:hypothetical protein